MKASFRGSTAAACLLTLGVGACATSMRPDRRQREVWRMVAMDGQKLPTRMPNGQKVRRANLFLTGKEYPRAFRIYFELSGWRKSPHNPNGYQGRISQPVPSGDGRTQALVISLSRSQMLPDLDSGDRITPLEERPVVTFVGKRLWVSIEGHMMVFQMPEGADENRP